MSPGQAERAPVERAPAAQAPAERDAVERHFGEVIGALDGHPPGGPGDRPPGPDPIRDGSALTGQRGLELFDAQLASRHLDLAASWLRAQDAGYSTIGSSGP